MKSIGGEWTFEKAFVSILDKKGHYCSCSRSTNSYYIFKSERGVLHVGDCCVSKIAKNLFLCEEEMSLRKREITEIIATKRKIYNSTYTPVYTSRVQRVL